MIVSLLLCCVFQQPPLTPAEKDILDAPFNDGLFDPAAAGAKRVRGTITLRTCYGKKKALEASGWLVPTAPGRPARFVLNSLQEVAPPENATPVPFPNPTFEEEFKSASFSDAALSTSFRDAQSFLWAAWSHRLGRDEEAARLLIRLKAEGLLDRFRAAYGWDLFSGAVNAFMVADDADALQAVKRLVKFESPYRKQGDSLRADLLRRQKEGTFGKTAPSLPKDLSTWPGQKRIETLIAALDQIEPDAKRPGCAELDGQPAARELLACGEAAVPALLRCLEVDTRLTRSIGVWREWSPNRSILSVRGASLLILGAILRTRHWDPRQEIPWLDIEEADAVQTWKKTVQRYWDEHGATPFPERMVRILTDPLSTLEARHEAAENLARIDRNPSIGLEKYRISADDPLRRTLRPELASFKRPTVAEAILAAMDHPSIGNSGGTQEKKYLTFIAELGDPRIARELRMRYEKATNPKTRHRLAFALRRLGESGPIDALAQAVDKGAEPVDVWDAVEIVYALGRSATPECEDVLAGFARKDHPWHTRAKDGILGRGSDEDAWVAHPYCLALLRGLLQDEATTGAVAAVEQDYVVRLGVKPGAFGYSQGPALPKERKDRVVERVCDMAAFRLSELIPDAPSYHPLLTNADARLKELRLYVDRHLGNFRRMTREEVADRGLPWWSVPWVVGR